MRALNFHQFSGILKALNPAFRFFDSATTRSAMVYLYDPRDPDCDHRGLSETLAVPAFWMNSVIYPFDWIDTKGLWNRGYTTWFKIAGKMRMASGKPLFSWHQALGLVPGLHSEFNSAQYRKDAKEKALTHEQKVRREAMKIFKPLPGNGMPLGWKRKKIYTFGN